MAQLLRRTGFSSLRAGVVSPPVLWKVPRYADFVVANGVLPPPLAARPLAAGETIESSYCVELTANSLAGSFLEPRCPVVTTEERDIRLFPMGWASLFPPRPDCATLTVEHRVTSPGAGAIAGRHQLLYRAARDVEEGEVLSVEDRGVVAPGGVRMPEVESSLPEPPPEHTFQGEWPENLLGPYAPKLSVGASSTHGLGVFAAEEIMEGEVLEMVPTLLANRAVNATALHNYAFEFSDDLVLLQLGLGMYFNHSVNANVRHQQVSSEGGLPLISVWTAERRIDPGEEICYDYGFSWWRARVGLRDG